MGRPPGRVSGKWHTLQCKRCGLSFDALISLPRVYCSARCRVADLSDAQRGRDPTKWRRTTCPTCGTDFDCLLSWPRTYCSKTCAGHANVGNLKPTKPTKPIALGPHAASCTRCGEPFEAKTGIRRNYCSAACRYRAIGDASRRRERGKWTRAACPTCGQQFDSLTSSGQTYCSLSCRSASAVARASYERNRTAYTKTCEVCGVAFAIRPSESASRCCSRACRDKWMSIHFRGEAHPCTGRKPGRPAHLPPAHTETCFMCGVVFQIKPSHGAKRVCCSKACYLRRFNPDGLPGVGSEPYYGPSWRPARRAVRSRDPVCRDCGKTPEQNDGRQLSVHHVVPFAAFGTPRHREANALSNLIALCAVCHTTREWADIRSRPTESVSH